MGEWAHVSGNDLLMHTLWMCTRKDAKQTTTSNDVIGFFCSITCPKQISIKRKNDILFFVEKHFTVDSRSVFGESFRNTARIFFGYWTRWVKSGEEQILCSRSFIIHRIRFISECPAGRSSSNLSFDLYWNLFMDSLRDNNKNLNNLHIFNVMHIS